MSYPTFVRTDGSNATWIASTPGGAITVDSAADGWARCKTMPEDFVVQEQLGWQPSGAGEHLLMLVRKRGLNTVDVVDALAKAVKLKSRDIGFAGMKDRVAVTEQWLSLPWPIKLPQPDWGGVADALFSSSPDQSVEFLDVARHHRKLPRGAHAGNRFRIVLRDVEGDRHMLERRLSALQQRGFPNLFGPQRFGRDAGNVHQAMRWFDGAAGRVSRARQGLLLSAARSYIFNYICALRIRQGDWLAPGVGEPLLLDATSSYFIPDSIDASVLERISAADVHTSGPLVGTLGQKLSAIEHAHCLQEHKQLLTDPVASILFRGLMAHGIASARRALRAMPRELLWHWSEPATLVLQFELPKGVYASALLLECLDVLEPAGGIARVD